MAKVDMVAAIESGDLAAFLPFLESGVDLSQPIAGDRDKRTPFELANACRADDIAVAIAKSGVKLRPRDLNLWWAVTKQDVELVRLFIAQGAIVDPESRMGAPLLMAAQWGPLEIALALIEAGADVNARHRNDSPLKSAIEGKQAEIALALVRAGAKPAADDDVLIQAIDKQMEQVALALIAVGTALDRRSDVIRWDEKKCDHVAKYVYATPLVVAAAMGQLAVVEALAAAGADLYLADGGGATALDWAQRGGHEKVVAALEAAMAKSPRKVAPEVDLLFAAERGDAAAVKKLLAAGAHVNARDERPRRKGWTPLMLAAAGGHVEAVRVLLGAGADLSLKDDNEKDNAGGFSFIINEGGVEMALEAGFQLHRTALAWAAHHGHADVVALLLARGAEIEGLDRVNATPLLMAGASGSAAAVRALLAGGANVDVKNKSKETPLMVAAQRGHAEVIAALAAQGAKIDLKHRDGYTALHIAASGAYPEAVAALVAAGADVNATTRAGHASLHLPLGTRHLIRDVEGEETVTKFQIDPQRIVATFRILLEAGANPEAPDRNGHSPIVCAEVMVSEWGVGHEFVSLLKSYLGKAGVKKPAKKPARRSPGFLDRVEMEKAKAKTKKKEKRKSLPELGRPKFGKAAMSKAYLAAVAELEETCGAKRQPMDGLAGGFTLRVHSSKTIELAELHEQFLAKGCYVFATDALEDTPLAILPTTSRDDVIGAMQTNGANFDLAPADVAAWLRELAEEQPFVMTGAGFDFLRGHFVKPVKNAATLAKRMYAFCPDIVDQGVGDVKELAAELKRTGKLFFWWD
jgi:ankyrin repeat protein